MSNASVNKNSKNVSVDLKYAPIWTHFFIRSPQNGYNWFINKPIGSICFDTEHIFSTCCSQTSLRHVLKLSRFWALVSKQISDRFWNWIDLSTCCSQTNLPWVLKLNRFWALASGKKKLTRFPYILNLFVVKTFAYFLVLIVVKSILFGEKW